MFEEPAADELQASAAFLFLGAEAFAAGAFEAGAEAGAGAVAAAKAGVAAVVTTQPTASTTRSARLGSDSPGSATICIISQAATMVWTADIFDGKLSSAFKAFAFATSDMHQRACH